MAPTLIDVNLIKENEDNPRILSDEKLAALRASLQSFPEMLQLRPIVAVKEPGGMLKAIGGNMRLRAAKAEGYKQVPVVVAEGLTDEQIREFIIKDNLAFGDWDWDDLRLNWPEAPDWGLEVPDVKDYEPPEEIEPSGYEAQWYLNVKCESEQDTQRLYEALTQQGYDCKIIT